MALTIDELATLVGGEIVRRGAGEPLDGVAALDEAGATDVSFLGNDRYHGQFLATAAGAVLVPPGEHGGAAATGLVAVANPTLAFQAVIERFVAAERRFRPGIDPRAVVAEGVDLDPAQVSLGPGVVIGAGTRIGPGTAIGANAVVGERVRIGRDCLIHPNVTIRDGCRLGDRVILHPGVVIGADGYGYQQVDGRHVKLPQVGIVELGDDVEVGANTTIDRARFGRTVVGEGTKIDNLVQVGHNVVIGKHCLIVAMSGMAGSCRLGDGVVAAAQVGIVGHVTVGAGAVLTARTGVTTDLEGGKTYAGKPAQPLMAEQRMQAGLRRLPKLMERVRRLEQRLGEDG